ncbi:MAG: hypothetical protein V7629_17085 [Motiliproteus sp.]
MADKVKGLIPLKPISLAETGQRYVPGIDKVLPPLDPSDAQRLVKCGAAKEPDKAPADVP